MEVAPIWQQALASSGCEKYLHNEQKCCLWAALGRVVMLRYFWDLLPTLTGCSATSALGAVAMPHWSCCELSREWGCFQLCDAHSQAVHEIGWCKSFSALAADCLTQINLIKYSDHHGRGTLYPMGSETSLCCQHGRTVESQNCGIS